MSFFGNNEKSPTEEEINRITSLVNQYPGKAFQVLNKKINSQGLMLSVREVPDELLTDEERMCKQHCLRQH
ncbi:hypothetical protein AB1Z76_25885 [Citrobacter freundii]|uniref:hypothetical protein n=1 Tax=Citrobacter freundii TaxID=546 RepID=UPI00345C0087